MCLARVTFFFCCAAPAITLRQNLKTMTASTIPERLKFDNADTIYPASLSKHFCSLFRMKVTMKDDIDAAILQEALVAASRRMPTFRCTMSVGAFWWYLQRVDKDPQIRPFKPLRHIDFRDQGGLLYRVSINQRQIVLDVFHALTDGTGAMTFLLTLAGEYIRRRYQTGIGYNNLCLDPKDAPVYAEVEDSFKTVFAGQHGQLEKNDNAYHLRGRIMPYNGARDLRMVLPQDRAGEVCRKYDCTVTELLLSVMLYALQEEHKRDTTSTRRKNPVIKVCMPVNLRPRYASRTVRNFSSYVNLGVDVRNGYLSFARIVRTVKAQKRRALLKEELEPKIAANVEIEDMFIVKCLPLVVKQHAIDIVNRLHGDRFFTHTLSNLGRINVPEEMIPYIADVDFILGRQRGNSGACSCLGYNGRLFFHMTRKIHKDGFERDVLKQLAALGIPVEASEEDLA